MIGIDLNRMDPMARYIDVFIPPIPPFSAHRWQVPKDADVLVERLCAPLSPDFVSVDGKN